MGNRKWKADELDPQVTECQRKEEVAADVVPDNETTIPQPKIPESTLPEEQGEEKPARQAEWTGSTELFF